MVKKNLHHHLIPDQGAKNCQIGLSEQYNLKAAFSLGTTYLQRNDHQNAMIWLKKALLAKPDWALTHNNIGKVYELRGDSTKAHTYYRNAADLDPGLAEAWFNLAELDARSGSFEQALAHYQNAIRLSPGMVAAHNNMGHLLKNLKRYPEAIAVFRKLLELAPGLAQGHYNLASTYHLTKQYLEAINHFAQAIKLKPDYSDAWNNMALVCKALGDLGRAMTCLDQALQINPQFSVARWNRSFVNFLMGNWDQGWRDFEARFDVPHWRSIYPHRINGTRWDGSPIPGGALLVHDEQGLGDTLQFARLLPWAKQFCKRLILETRPEIAPLLDSTLGIDELIIRSSEGPPAVSFDRYIPLMSLGFMAQAHPDRLPLRIPYIKAPLDKVTHWGRRIQSKGIHVGLVWAGRPEHGNDENRSCTLDLFAPLFNLPGFEFIGLQKGPAAAQIRRAIGCKRLSNWGDDLDSFGDTAGIIHHLDLVLTVDTSVAHLAGAMGRPVWVLLPFIPDWRWGMKGTQTGWYPTMRLFRQEKPGDWETVIRQIKADLELKADPKAF